MLLQYEILEKLVTYIFEHSNEINSCPDRVVTSDLKVLSQMTYQFPTHGWIMTSKLSYPKSQTLFTCAKLVLIYIILGINRQSLAKKYSAISPSLHFGGRHKDSKYVRYVQGKLRLST